ncbi:hypothetical protein NQ317_006645 [Molorchus minor]|uniref:Uncharacterized protein n=1 Tax=Molorchus minor TaxID=1323400 RepID=A0ABQ9IXR0_9CUCU|nr:hypothetical protein NQ317_006645 [Molorchus minor]
MFTTQHIAVFTGREHVNLIWQDDSLFQSQIPEFIAPYQRLMFSETHYFGVLNPLTINDPDFVL